MSSNSPTDFQPLFPQYESGGFQALDERQPAAEGFTPTGSPEQTSEHSQPVEAFEHLSAPGSSTSPDSLDSTDDESLANESLDIESAGDEQAPSLPEEVHDGDFLQAREEAYEVGRRAGLEAGKAETDAQVLALQGVLADLGTARQTVFEQCITDVAKATVEISRRVVGRELSIGVGDLEALVKDILDELRADDEIVVHIAPEDDRYLRNGYPALLAHVGRDASLRIETAANVTPGGVLVETSFGTVDATVESRFDTFAEAVDSWARDAVERFDD
jgi:flagellar assembly protein FliH